MEFCLLAGGATVRLATVALTLAWTHSVQKTRWEEDWRIERDRIVLVEARVEGSGAGMDPGADARFDGHWWRWRPVLPPLRKIDLRRSGATADWTVCIDGTCRPMGDLVPRDADPVTMAPCS